MDLMAAVQEYNASPEQRRARAARHELRSQLVYSRIGQALGRESAQRFDGETQGRLAELDDLERLMRTAAGWNLPVGEEVDDGALIGNQHPGAAALVIVRHALSEYSIPTDVELRYHGIKRASGHGAFGVNDGIVYVQATLHSVSGPRHHVDIPVVMRAGRVLAPSILMHQGTARILTQHTFDDIIGMGEFTAKAPDRPHMFAPGPDKDANAAPRREIPRLSPNMFRPMPGRNLIRGAITGVHQASSTRQADWDSIAPEPQDPQVLAQVMELASKIQREMRCDARQAILEAMDQLVPDQQQAQVMARLAFYNPDVFGLLENGSLGKDVPGANGSHVDVGERSLKDALTPGQRVRIKAEAVARDRGGVAYAVPRGTRGKVVRDVDGAGRAYYVRFDELGFSCTVPREALSG